MLASIDKNKAYGIIIKEEEVEVVPKNRKNRIVPKVKIKCKKK